jgi:hypothetical protein
VDVAFFGHHHSYQRTCPVYNSICVKAHGIDAPKPILDDTLRGKVADENQFGTVYIVTGAAGAGNSQNIQKPQPGHFLYVDCTTHGYTRASVSGNTARFQYVSGKDRTILDDVTLQLPAHRRQPQPNVAAVV